MDMKHDLYFVFIQQFLGILSLTSKSVRNEQFENTKGVARRRQLKNRQTMVNKTLHRKLKIEEHELN
jgi:hypothetical protein